MSTTPTASYDQVFRIHKKRRRRIVGQIKRFVIVGLFVVVRLLKPLPFLHFLLPRRFRLFARHWTPEMLNAVIRSRGRRVLIDTPTTVRVPASFAPRVRTEERYRLTEEQIRSFHENGFLAPLKLCSREEMAELLRDIEREAMGPSRAYGFPTGRDRHIDCPSVLRAATLPALHEQVAQLVGPDLLLWRTQILPKPPGAREIAWHQATTFVFSGRAMLPVLEPADLGELFNVTAWIALEDVDTENGCMQFYRGSQRLPVHEVRVGAGQSFGISSFQLICDIDESKVADIELKAGEFVIFHERTVHGSRPNSTANRRRMGMNCRICRTDVRVYHSMAVDRSLTFGEDYDLSKWGVVLLRGQDQFRRSPYAQLDRYQPSAAGPAAGAVLAGHS